MQYLQFHNIARRRGKSTVSDEEHLRNKQERFFEANITNHKGAGAKNRLLSNTHDWYRFFCGHPERCNSIFMLSVL
jgi:hypothetical protein